MTEKKIKTTAEKLADSHYQPNKTDMKTDISVPVTPERLVKAVVQGGAQRREDRAADK